MTQLKSPRISHISWGQLKVEGNAASYKDAKLFPGGSREWDWNETSTHHEPGIQISDVEELLDNGAEVVVLSRGYWEKLRVKKETLEHLEKKAVKVHVLETGEAAELYNRLRESEKVGGLFHSTC